MALKKGLGKGLDALFADNSTPGGVSPEHIKLTEIEPNRNQPRKVFDEEPLQQLAESIRENGLLQPLLVRPLPEGGGYQLVAGERRWRACRMAGLTEVPVVIREIDDQKTMELALIENLQRENLNPMEEAMGYHELMETYGLTQADVAKSVGKSRSAVANTLRLLSLPEPVAAYVREGKLSSGHARALLALEEEQQIRETAERAVRQGLTVRDLERISKGPGIPKESRAPRASSRDSYFDELEIALKAELGRKVKINSGPKDQGVLEITFHSREDLRDIAERLSRYR